jgi:hypothetical protein
VDSVLEDPKEIPITTYNRALKLAKKYEMNDVTQAILAVVTSKYANTPEPFSLTQSFERLTFAMDHPEMHTNFAIKHFSDICQAEEDPQLSHLEMLKSHLNCILQIMNGRVWIRSHVKKHKQSGNLYWTGMDYDAWGRWVKGKFE